MKSSSAAAGGGSRRGLNAPKLRPESLRTQEQIETLKSSPDFETTKERVSDLLRRALGERSVFSDRGGIAAPHAASTTRDRSAAAADVAVAARELGVVVVLKRCGVLEEIEQMLIPLGIGAVFGNKDGTNPGGGMRKIASAVSLSSMGAASDASIGSGTTGVTDSKKGKSTPANAREGSLLVLRALCETVGRAAEPFVVPLLAAVLDESGSSSSAVREASEDTAIAIVSLANKHAVKALVCPVLFEALHSPEWRVKHSALERLSQCAATAPAQISALLPEIIPKVTPQVWDTKAQVTKAAKATLLATCGTNVNPDVAPAIPAVVNAICKPSETSKAIDELLGTTFVAAVDASTLSILCPVLSRGLKDKMALQKRSCCVVIENMSRLVDSPGAVAPFGPLLVPELKKVAENVQFEEIRDAALKALKALTKALGHASVESAVQSVMAEEAERVEAEQRRIEEQREEEARREEANRKKEEVERAQWKEAMEAQRLLDKLAEKEEEEKKAEEAKKKDKDKRSVKGRGGKCQGCGLKKCKKGCLFNSGK